MANQDGVVNIHVNQIYVASSQVDFVFTISQDYPIQIAPEEGAQEDKEKLSIKVVRNTVARLFLSPQYAKIFSKELQTIIEKHEKNFGEIHIE